MTAGSADVTLVVNTFERTYRTVLTPAFFAQIAHDCQRQFEKVTVLINNVNDPDAVRELANGLCRDGVISSYVTVADELATCLARVKLRDADLGRLPHYSDCFIVAPFVVDTEYLLYWDADVRLLTPAPWVDEAMSLLASNPTLWVASPQPSEREYSQVARRSAGVLYDYGFSDQLFLVRTHDFRQPLYGELAPASLRFPLSHVTYTAEQRVDSYMRNRGLQRALLT